MIRRLCLQNIPSSYRQHLGNPASLSRTGASFRKRFETTQAGDNHSGHIDVAQDEGILFFDNVFPLKFQWLAGIPLISRKTLESFQTKTTASINPGEVLKEALRKSHLSASTSDVQINGIIPRLKDGGAFLRFSHSASAKTISEIVNTYLKENRLKPWWNPFTRVRAHLVRGRPWVEDLYRPPSCRIKVEFIPGSGQIEAAELSQEDLYSLFRPYGKLLEITSQPPDSKILPKFAYLDFAQMKRAIMARNCLHGSTIKSEDGKNVLAKLKLSYERRSKSSWFREWLFGHPRVVIPLMAALLTGFAVAVFDPIRTWFVKMHVSGTLSLSRNRFYRWLHSTASELLTFHRQEQSPGTDALWDDRKGNIEQLEKWLMETADTFIVVQGPRGSGKRELVVDQALKYRKNKLVIDCKPIQESRSDSKTIEAAAKQGLIDLAAQGAVGMKTGFSETLDSQLDKILSNTATALKQLALENRSKNDKDVSLGPDEYIEAHPEKRPVVIIDNFLHKASDSPVIYDKLAEWAARLTASSTAHVIFLTHDVAFSKSLSKALPDRVFRQITLGDFQPAVARRYVVSHIDSEPNEVILDASGKPTRLSASQRRKDLTELDEVISSVGGRLTDLEFLARRIKAGETPKTAVQEMINQSASEIMKMYLFVGGEAERQWRPAQAWTLVKALASSSELRYNELGLWDAFKGVDVDGVLQALEQAELISIVSMNGRPQAVRPSKPVFQPAFKILAEDEVLSSRLDIGLVGEQIKGETATIDKMEAELELLGRLPTRPHQLNARIRWLLGKIEASQAKIEALEAKHADLKKVLMSQY